MANDMQIQHDVLAALTQEHIIAGTVGVEVHHGVVKLAGRVDNNAIKEGAARVAARVENVTEVVMDVDVAGAGAVKRPSIV